MIELSIYFGIAAVSSFLIAILGVSLEETALKVRENHSANKVFSWLFLYPIFEKFYSFLEWLRKAIISLGKFFLSVIVISFAISVLGGLIYLVVLAYKAIF